MEQLSTVMNYKSAYDVGDIHRYLSQPREHNHESFNRLRENLNRANSDALAYVCLDLGVLPTGKFSKSDMIKVLVSWVCKTIPRSF